MKYYIIFFSLFFLLNTEGVAQVPVVDSSEIQNDIVEEEENAEEIAAANEAERAYQENLQKYYQEDINTKEFDKEAWEKATKDIDYTVEEGNKKKKKKGNGNGEEDKEPYRDPIKFSPTVIAFLKWLFIGIAIALLGYLIYRFVDGGNLFSNTSRRINISSVGIDLEQLEENLEASDDIEPFIQKAIAQKQFALAIRLYYLAILKELTLKNAIEWKKDKTNRAYVREMRSHKLFDNFRNLTAIFERVWYGDTRLDEAHFMDIQPAFRDLLTQSKSV